LSFRGATKRSNEGAKKQTNKKQKSIFGMLLVGYLKQT